MPEPTSANGSAKAASAAAPNEEVKVYTCTICVQRKVRCDRRLPCTACVKSQLQCSYRNTPPLSRRKRRFESPNQALLERVRSHEAALRAAGVNFEPFKDVELGSEEADQTGVEPADVPRVTATHPARPVALPVAPAARPSLPHRGIMVPEHGGMRYYEHGLVGALGREFRQGRVNFASHHPVGDTVDAASSQGLQDFADALNSSIATGSPDAAQRPRSRHPTPAVAAEFWSKFCSNVHPLTMIVHPPSMQDLILNHDPVVPASTDALKFSIFACAVASLDEDECRKTFGRGQASLLREFQSATRYALSESVFLRVPDVDLLRANVLFLISMFLTSDSTSIWLLMGTTMRMAISQGLHRDGLRLGLSAFETEMRRRLWWFMLTLDERLSELVGSDNTHPVASDTTLPSNLNDNDLDPNMVGLPEGRSGVSEMTFCLVRYELARFRREIDPRLDQSEQEFSARRLGPTTPRQSIANLESLLEEKYLRFCDPVSPVQFLTSSLARSQLCKLKQMEHRLKFHSSPDNERTTNLEQTKILLNIATRNIEYDNLIHNIKSLRKFFWYVHFHFPWGAPIVILKLLGSFAEWDADMNAAWAQIEELHEHHPEFRSESKVLHLIIASLTLKAWHSHASGLEAQGRERPPTPAILKALQDRQSRFITQYASGSELPVVNDEEIDFNDFTAFSAFENSEIFDPMATAFTAADWSYWGDC